jgi:hypothetical protein
MPAQLVKYKQNILPSSVITENWQTSARLAKRKAMFTACCAVCTLFAPVWEVDILCGPSKHTSKQIRSSGLYTLTQMPLFFIYLMSRSISD